MNSQNQSQHWSVKQEDWTEMQNGIKTILAGQRTLENRVTQLERLQSDRTPGSLPSDTIPNPKGRNQEHVKAVTLRSGKELPDLIKKPATLSHSDEQEQEVAEPEEKVQEE